VHGDAAFVVERPHLGPFDRRLLSGERCDDAVVPANDEGQVVDDVVDRNHGSAGVGARLEQSHLQDILVVPVMLVYDVHVVGLWPGRPASAGC
jgi:hypothetical protein